MTRQMQLTLGFQQQKPQRPASKTCPVCGQHVNNCRCPFPRLRHSGFCRCGFQFLRCECANAVGLEGPCPQCKEPRTFYQCGHITAHRKEHRR